MSIIDSVGQAALKREVEGKPETIEALKFLWSNHAEERTQHLFATWPGQYPRIFYLSFEKIESLDPILLEVDWQAVQRASATALKQPKTFNTFGGAQSYLAQQQDKRIPNIPPYEVIQGGKHLHIWIRPSQTGQPTPELRLIDALSVMTVHYSMMTPKWFHEAFMLRKQFRRMKHDFAGLPEGLWPHEESGHGFRYYWVKQLP